MQLRVNGANVYYERYHANRGPAVVLIHGSGDNSGAWYPQIPTLVQSYDVIALDVRGHGKTEVLNGDYSNDAIVTDIRQLLDALDLKQAAVIGYSMGGGLAAQFAATSPERTLAAVLTNGVGSLEPPSPEQQQQMQERRQRQLGILEKEGMAGVYQDRIAAGNTFTQEFASRSPIPLQRYRDIMLANNPQEYLKKLQAGPAARPAYEQITAPTLIIAGEHDTGSTPAAARAVAALMPNARVAVFPTAHFTALEMPQEWNRLVYGFLQQHLSGGWRAATWRPLPGRASTVDPALVGGSRENHPGSNS